MASFNIIHVAHSTTFSSLCAEHHVPYQKGMCYYLLSKKENVSASKELFAYHESGEFCMNLTEIRSKFSLPPGNITPACMPRDWELYIQSTSPNRKLAAGTKALIRGDSLPIPPSSTSSSATSNVTKSKSNQKSVPPQKNKAADEPKKRKAIAEPETASQPQQVPKANLPATVSSFPGKQGWVEHKPGSLSIRDYGCSHSTVIAGFDMDWTLIRTKSGKTFPQHADDYMLWDPCVPAKLQQTYQDGKKILVFTNQMGITKGKETLSNIQKKLDKLQALFNVPMMAVIMYGNDLMRKPRVGAWELIENTLNGGIKVNRNESIYVGDGAGRVPPAVVKKDFGPGDLLFALNLGTQFNTPEEFFQNAKSGSYSLKFPFDPRELGLNPKKIPLNVTNSLNDIEIVICIGAPGSGKSSLSKKAFPNHVHVNRDQLKTKQKCWKVCEESIQNGKSVVIDNQNRAKSDRSEYLSIAKKYKIPCRAVRIDMPKELCFHLNEYRALNKQSAENRGDERVPSMVIHGFYKNVEEPTIQEGFANVSHLGLEHLELVGTKQDLTLIRSFLCT